MTARDRGRCGAPCPSLPGVACELLAEHIGQHEGRQHPVGVVSTGWPVYWPQASTAPDRDAAAAVAAQILARQRGGPLSDEDLGRYVADSVLVAALCGAR